jgi:hypothetical protein
MIIDKRGARGDRLPQVFIAERKDAQDLLLKISYLGLIFIQYKRP